VLSTAASKELNGRLRALGFTVYDPDVSMFTLGGGGVHCMCQALRRDPA
jgi:N-dimethylarginine dimethylaminohydrolase